ncbi:MAG: enoyl-CoA hydratase/isomerase family protein [Alphaproteobacteria bacterium]
MSATDQERHVALAIAGNRARILIDNPRKLNALAMPAIDQLDAALDAIEAAPGLRLVEITGSGERAFSAGGDVRQWSSLQPGEMARRWIRRGNRVFGRLAALDLPVICLLNGDALGGGLELALAADTRIAAAGIRLAAPEPVLGAVPGWLGCQRLVETVGPARARQLVLFGRSLTAEEALDWGLVDAVVPRDGLRAEADRLAEAVTARAPVAVALSKRLLRAAQGQETVETLYELAAARALASAGGREARAPSPRSARPALPTTWTEKGESDGRARGQGRRDPAGRLRHLSADRRCRRARGRGRA